MIPLRHTAALALLLLTACGSPQAQTPSNDGPVDAHRVDLPAPDPAPANADGKANWSMANGVARFGVEGAAPLLTFACTDHQLVITRPIPAEVGASALFAIEGPKKIVRVPVDATALPGQRGYVWQGHVPGDDKDNDVFTERFTGTLPGGGLIKVTPGDAARDVIARCKKA